MQLSDLPRTINRPWASSAQPDYTTRVPDTGAGAGRAAYDTGFPPETFTPESAGGTPPSGQDFNGAFGDLSAWARWVKAGSATFYDGAFATAVGGYPKGAQLASTTPGVVWQSANDNNTTDPDSNSAAGWIKITSPPGDTSQNIIRHPSGFLEQWGYVSYTSSGEPTVSVTLLTPFADAGYNIQITPSINAPSGTADTWVQIVRNSKTTTGFSTQYQRGAGQTQPNLDGFDWRCIGKGA